MSDEWLRLPMYVYTSTSILCGKHYYSSGFQFKLRELKTTKLPVDLLHFSNQSLTSSLIYTPATAGQWPHQWHPAARRTWQAAGLYPRGTASWPRGLWWRRLLGGWLWVWGWWNGRVWRATKCTWSYCRWGTEEARRRWGNSNVLQCCRRVFGSN